MPGNSTRLGPGQIEALLQTQRPVVYPAQCIIYTQGEKQDRVYYLASGLVKFAFFDRNGREKALGSLGPGHFFGEPGVFGRRAYGITALTQRTSRIYAIAGDEIRRWMREDAMLAFALMESMADKIWLMGRQLCSLAFQDARGAVASTLLDMLWHEPGAGSAGRGAVSLTQQQLGAITGLSRVTISRVLHEFAEQGMVHIGRGAIQVANATGLRDLTRF